MITFIQFIYNNIPLHIGIHHIVLVLQCLNLRTWCKAFCSNCTVCPRKMSTVHVFQRFNNITLRSIFLPYGPVTH